MSKVSFYLISLIFFFTTSVRLYGQSTQEEVDDNKKDSLKRVLAINEGNDSLQIKCLYELANLYSSDSIFYFIQQGIDLSERYAKSSVGNINKRAVFFLYKGNFYLGQSYFKKEMNDSAIYFFEKGVKYAEDINHNIASAECINNIGFIYYQQGEIENALTYFYKSLNFLQLAKDSVNISNLLSNIGYIHKSQDELDKALDCFKKGLEINKVINDSMGLAYSYNDIGVVYTLLKDTTQALIFLENSLTIRRVIGNKRLLASSLQNLGYLYVEKGSFDKGYTLLKQGEVIYEEINDKEGKCKSYQYLAKAFVQKEAYSKAVIYAEKNVALAQELGNPNLIKLGASQLSFIYKKLERGLEALKMYKLSIKMRDSLKNERTLKANIKQESKYEYEIKAASDSIKNAESAKVKDALLVAEKAENKSKSFLNIAIGIGLVLVIFFAFVIIRGYKIRQDVLNHEIEIEVHKSNKIKNDLEQKEKELELKLQMITEKVGVIENLKKQLINTSNDTEYVDKIISSLEQNYVSDKNWDNIIQLFSTMHKDFIPNLKSKNSNITRSDIRISILMKLNYSNSGMAETLNISVEGVKKAKQRLKKKIEQNEHLLKQ